MNILVITGPYGAKMSPESSCIDKYLRQLGDDYEVHVVCPWTNGNSSDEYNGFKVYYVSNFWNSLRCYCQKRLEAQSSNNKTTLFWQIVLNIVRMRGYLLSYFRFPTRNVWLIKAYKKKLKELEFAINPEAIISVGGLPCAHWAAMNYKIAHPDVKWLTYTLDPVTINDDAYENILFKGNRRKRYHQMEKSFWETAGWNLFTEELYPLMKEEFGDKKNNYICFPYVLTKPFIERCATKQKREKILAVYAGALYLNIRNPRMMLEVMSKVENVKTELYTSGECDGLISEYEGGNIERKGMLPREQYLHLINNEADVLINIGNSTNLMAPSKFFELLSTGLPLINFYTAKNTNYKMTERYPLGLNIGGDVANPSERVQQFCESMKGKRLSFEEVESLFPENNLDKQVNKLKECLNNY